MNLVLVGEGLGLLLAGISLEGRLLFIGVEEEMCGWNS